MRRTSSLALVALLAFPFAARASDAVISGVITDAAGTAVASVEIDARLAGSATIVTSALSDTTGHYSLTVTQGSSYDLTVTPSQSSGLSGAPVTGVSASQPVNLVNFTLVAPAGPGSVVTVSGTVTTSYGDPVTNADIDVRRPSDDLVLYTTTTDGSGNYTLSNIAVGTYSFQMCTGCVSHASPATIPRDNTQWIRAVPSYVVSASSNSANVVLPVVKHTMTVTDENGVPVPNVLLVMNTLVFGTLPGDALLSDANGNIQFALWDPSFIDEGNSYVFDLVPMIGSGFAMHSMVAPWSTPPTAVTYRHAVSYSVGIQTETASPYTIVSAAPGSVTGYIVPHNTISNYPYLYGTTANISGQPAAFTNLSYQVQDFTTGEWTYILDPDTEYYNETVTLSAVNAVIANSGDQRHVTQCAAGVEPCPDNDYPQGNFGLPTFADDGQTTHTSYSVFIDHDEDLGIIPLPTCFLSGHVTDQNNQPVVHAQVLTTDTDNIEFTDATGAYQLPLLNGAAYAAGAVSYTLEVYPPGASGSGGATVVHSLTCNALQVTRDVQVSTPVSVSGHVYGSDGVTPVAGMQLTFYNESGTTEELQIDTNSSGAYSGTIAGGPVVVTFVKGFSGTDNTPPTADAARTLLYASGQTIASHTIDLSQGSSNLDFVIPSQSLGGKLVDSNGIPIQGATVTMYGADSYIINQATTAADGSYLLGFVPFVINTSPSLPWDDGIPVATPNQPASDLRYFTSENYGEIDYTPPSGANLGSAVIPHSVLGNITGDFSQNLILSTINTTPPIIVAGPTIVSITDTSLAVQWSTNETSTSSAAIALHGQTPVTSASDNGLVLTHLLTLTNLSPSTTYDLDVTSVDAAGNSVTSQIITATTNALPNTTPPELLSDVIAINVTNTLATITWNTSDPSTSVANYGTTTSLGSSGTASGLTLSHSVQLSGLTPGTTYYFDATSCDVDNNCSTFQPLHFFTFTTLAQADTTPPQILTGPTVSDITDHTALVTWTTDEASTSGASAHDANNQFVTPSDSGYVTQHSLLLTGLVANTAYSFTVTSTDPSGNTVVSTPGSFTTAALPDTTPPVITDLEVLYLSPTIAVVEWDTNKATDGQIAYVFNGQTLTLVDSNIGTSHQIQISGLPIATSVPFTVSSTDTSGNGPVTESGTILTTATADVTPPVISNVVITPSGSNIDVQWTTNEAATSRVDYAEGAQLPASDLTLTRSNGNFALTHDVLLTDLTPCNSYSLELSSVDPSGNIAVTSVYTVALGANSQACLCASTAYTPYASGFNLMLFEDNWPEDGDLDFNDQSIAYNYELAFDNNGNVTALQAHYLVMSIGADLHNGLYLHLPVARGAASASTLQIGTNGTPHALAPISSEHELVLPILDDTRSAFNNASGFINTVAGNTVANGTEVALTVTFSPAITLDSGAAPFDLFIARTGTFGHQIHQPQYPGTDGMDQSLFTQGQAMVGNGLYFVDKNGLPFALNVPGNTFWPQETIAISDAYPDIVTFASSGGATNDDWYSSTVNGSALFQQGGLTQPATFLPDLTDTAVCGAGQ